jgi:hypothetical protein
MFRHLCAILREFQFFLNCNFNSLNFENLCNLARHKKLKLPKDDTEMSKHVEANIIQ